PGVKVSAVAPLELARWWKVFDDPVLTRLVEQAEAGNTDLRQARARVREARARRGISRAARFPAIDMSGSAASSHSSEETGSGATRELYAAGFDASWELDLFGAKRRAEEAAAADLDASQEDLHDVLVSLLAEVATNYLEVRTYQARLAIARGSLNTREETAGLIGQRQATGLASGLEVEQTIASLEQARAQLPALESGREQAANRLAVLLGRQPGALAADLADLQPIPAAPEQLVVGVPAEVLRHRPDVRRAERQLAAQTARIGVATAALYPDLSLSGSIGLEAFVPERVFNSRSRNSSARAGLSWALFDFGAIRRNIEVQNALQEQALGKYQGAMLTALEEVENFLTAYDREQQRYQALGRAAAAEENALALARQQYTAGLVDFLTVLDSQRSLLTLQDQVATSRSAITGNLISLYKALGGGWSSLAAADKETLPE
ncbi:MAG: efflux transporter outer membrane subunit, partial [Desulfobulbaceae bacterium]|nr:efflux transporter outer membrane subunit [Desulfobulbaceae bacterium]